MKTIGIVAHSAEGASLCFLTACREGAEQLGRQYMHPTIVMSAVPMALSMPGWDAGDHKTVGKFLSEGVRLVADAGADFYICPDNTAHIALEQIADQLPVPGIHIAGAVCREIDVRRFGRVGLLGTKWTMTGPVYPNALSKNGIEYLAPDEVTMDRLHAAIFDELCLGVFEPATTDLFLRAIEDLKSRGADSVILGCTEIPLIVTPANSPLPVLDSTRLLAKYAVREAISEEPVAVPAGWLPLTL